MNNHRVYCFSCRPTVCTRRPTKNSNY